MPRNVHSQSALLLIFVSAGLVLAPSVVSAQDSTAAVPTQPRQTPTANTPRFDRLTLETSEGTTEPSILIDSLNVGTDLVRAALQQILMAAADSAGPIAPVGPLTAMGPALRGMVWQPPDSIDAALEDLLDMRHMGVGVIRTPVIEDTLLLRAADVLGIAFYQDLPIANLPAPRLIDTLSFAERALTEMLRRAQRFQSARHFGLARYVDTSDPRARSYFERLAQIIRTQGPAGSQAYYLSRFPSDDLCDHTVDFVLLDARQADPVDLLRKWRRRHETPAGIGAFGAPLRPGKDGGWREIGTPSSQARTLENGLGNILEDPIVPSALFIYRWRDAVGGGGGLNQRARVEGVVFGLNGSVVDSLARPALDVARGFFTGTQRVFAFDAGNEGSETRSAALMVLIGWLLLMGMGMVYWIAPRFGALSSKYFVRHDLYRESIQRGYDLNAGLNAVIGVSVSLAGAVVGASALRALGRTDTLSTAVSSWSLAAQTRLNQLLGEPLLLILLLSLCYGLWLLFNILWLFFLAGRRHRIRAQQALTLVVWSRWALLALMVCAMILAALPPRAATALAPVLLFVWLAVEIVATGRMLNDFGHVTRVPMQRAILLGYGAPLGVITVLLVVLFIGGQAELGFLWHLATRN